MEIEGGETAPRRDVDILVLLRIALTEYMQGHRFCDHQESKSERS